MNGAVNAEERTARALKFIVQGAVTAAPVPGGPIAKRAINSELTDDAIDKAIERLTRTKSTSSLPFNEILDTLISNANVFKNVKMEIVFPFPEFTSSEASGGPVGVGPSPLEVLADQFTDWAEPTRRQRSNGWVRRCGLALRAQR